MGMCRNDTGQRGRGDKTAQHRIVRPLTKIFLKNRSVPQKFWGGNLECT